MRTAVHIITQQRIAAAVTAVVNQTPAGATRTALYEPLSRYLGTDEFDQLMRLLVMTKRIARRGGRYYPTAGSSAF